MSAWDAPGDGLPEGGGAAACRLSERRRRRADAAEDGGHGGVNCGALVKFRQAELRRGGRGRGGGGRCMLGFEGGAPEWRHRLRRPTANSAPRRREKGGGGLCGTFYRKVHDFIVFYTSVPRLAFLWTAGCFFGFDRGPFAKASRSVCAGRWIDDGRCGSWHYSSLFFSVVVQC